MYWSSYIKSLHSGTFLQMIEKLLVTQLKRRESLATIKKIDRYWRLAI
jgi:hypothetical protein